jgi:hypothetical protein
VRLTGDPCQGAELAPADPRRIRRRSQFARSPLLGGLGLGATVSVSGEEAGAPGNGWSLGWAAIPAHAESGHQLRLPDFPTTRTPCAPSPPSIGSYRAPEGHPCCSGCRRSRRRTCPSLGAFGSASATHSPGCYTRCGTGERSRGRGALRPTSRSDNGQARAPTWCAAS